MYIRQVIYKKLMYVIQLVKRSVVNCFLFFLEGVRKERHGHLVVYTRHLTDYRNNEIKL